MVFSSLLFLFIFLPAVLLLYFAVPKKFRNFILFITSLFFYAWGEPIYILIMIFSTIVDYTHGMLVHHFKEKGEIKKAKLAVLSSMVINLGLLCFFKYGDFILENINAVFGTAIPLMKLALPIGISFYTFQTMSYTIDVFRGDAKVQKNIISFGTYVVLFPQLIAGPIVQYKTIAEQLDSRRETVSDFNVGVSRFMMGLGKKVLLANNIGYLWSQVSAMELESLPVVTAWLGILAFTFQIYFDFSGYSDMAIGLGRMFGFKFLENFDHPYMSKSITEFWRRWHISLGTWFKEYVYIPLGGNRNGYAKQIRNICVVWLLTGIWHGASWNFLVWGAYFGFLLVMEKLFLLKWIKKAPSFVSHIYTMFLVIISWAIFAFDDMASGYVYIKSMFGLNGNAFSNGESVYLLYTNLILFAIMIFASTDWGLKLGRLVMDKLENKAYLRETVRNVAFASIFLLSVAYLVDASFNPFLYFRF